MLEDVPFPLVYNVVHSLINRMTWRGRTAWHWSELPCWRRGSGGSRRLSRGSSSLRLSWSRKKRRLGDAMPSRSVSMIFIWFMTKKHLLCPSRLKAEEDRQKKEDEKARREFIKQEYLRRKQLKLMEDMDVLVKARPTAAKLKKPRPKSIHRDVIESPKTPVRATAGKRADALNLGKTCLLCATLLFFCSLHFCRSILTGTATLSNF